MGLATLYSGIGSAIGAGAEVTYGTAVARTNWRPCVTQDIRRDVPDFDRQGLDGNGGMSRGAIRSADNVVGGWSMECTYYNMGMWLDHLFGASSSAGAGAPYTHTYTIADQVRTGLTLEALRGKDNAEVFEGCKLNAATFSCSPGGVLMMSIDDVIGETSAARTSSPGTASYGATTIVVEHHHATQMTFNSVNYDLVDFSLTINNGLVRRPYLGSLVTKEPTRGNRPVVSCRFTVEVVDTLQAAMTAKTESDLTFGFSNPGSDEEFDFTLQNARIASLTGPIQGPGMIRETFVARGYSDGTNHGLKIDVINDSAQATAN